jgi:hypothetical protein
MQIIRFCADNEAKGLPLTYSQEAAVYFSEPALNQVENARSTANTGTSLGLTTKFLAFSRQTSVLHESGAADKVDFALKLARRAGRKTWLKLDDVNDPMTVFDIEVNDLHVGVMPFAYFGCYGEGPRRRRGLVRAFWAQTLVPARRSHAAGSSRELILLGSLSRLTDEPWNGEDEAALKIGHGYPSDPSVLSRLVRTELQLEDSSVQNHIDSVDRFETLEPGCYARFASAQTARARKALVRDEGFVTHWERRPPLSRARVVAIAHDVSDSSQYARAQSTVLARPILIRDLSS